MLLPDNFYRWTKSRWASSSFWLHALCLSTRPSPSNVTIVFWHAVNGTELQRCLGQPPKNELLLEVSFPVKSVGKLAFPKESATPFLRSEQTEREKFLWNPKLQNSFRNPSFRTGLNSICRPYIPHKKFIVPPSAIVSVFFSFDFVCLGVRYYRKLINC